MASTDPIPRYQDLVSPDQWLEPLRQGTIHPQSVGVIERRGADNPGRGAIPAGALALRRATQPEYRPTAIDVPWRTVQNDGRYPEHVPFTFAPETILDQVIPPGYSLEYRDYPPEDEQGRPLGPFLTGVEGRLTNDKFGPILAVDALVVESQAEGQDPLDARFLAVKRADGAWALPAGLIDPGETPRQALRRETQEETSLDLDFTDGSIISAGYVGRETRNSDCSWIESIAVKLKVGKEVVGRPLQVQAGETEDLRWMMVRELLDMEDAKVHGDTKLFVRLAMNIQGRMSNQSSGL